MIVIRAFITPQKKGSRIQEFEPLTHFSTFRIPKSAIRNSKTSQLALGDFDFHLIEKISHLVHGNFIFAGDFLSHGTGNFSILGCFLQLGGNFFLFQDPILLWRVSSPLLRKEGDGGKNL
jgi:hypothetical protein